MKTRECRGCEGTGDRFLDTNIPAGMECGAEVTSGRYLGSVCGAPARWRNTTKNAGDSGFYKQGDLDAHLCDAHLIEAETRACPEGQHARTFTDNPDVPDTVACLVCGGTGQVVDDSTSTRDALADAETLRRNVEAGDPWVGSHVRRASHFAWCFKREKYWLDDRPSSTSVLIARVSARAAFRAVPGLRGDA